MSEGAADGDNCGGTTAGTESRTDSSAGKYPTTCACDEAHEGKGAANAKAVTDLTHKRDADKDPDRKRAEKRSQRQSGGVRG